MHFGFLQAILVVGAVRIVGRALQRRDASAPRVNLRECLVAKMALRFELSTRILLKSRDLSLQLLDKVGDERAAICSDFARIRDLEKPSFDLHPDQLVLLDTFRVIEILDSRLAEEIDSSRVLADVIGLVSGPVQRQST